MKSELDLSMKYYNKALDAATKNRVSEAVKILEQSTLLFPNNTDMLDLLGFCEYRLCNFKSATYYWKKSLEINNKDERAIKFLDELNSSETKELISLYNNALEKINTKKYKEAINNMKIVLSIEDNLIEPYFVTSYCYLKLGMYKQAKEYINKALELDKSNERLRSYLKEMKHTRGGIGSLSKSTIVTLCSVTALCIICITFTMLFIKNKSQYKNAVSNINKYEQKVKQYNSQLDKMQSDYKGLEESLQKEKKEKEQLNSKLKEKESKDKQSSTSSNSTVSSQVSNKPVQIEDEWQSFSDTFELYNSGSYDKAIPQLELLVTNAKNESVKSESLFILSMSYKNTGNFKKAEECFINYVEKYKDKNYYPEALYNLGITLYEEGNKEKSKFYLNQLVKDAPDSMFNNTKVQSILNNN